MAKSTLLVAPNFSRSESCNVIEGALKIYKSPSFSVLCFWANHLTTLKDGLLFFW